jgi:hypothetical protein
MVPMSSRGLRSAESRMPIAFSSDSSRSSRAMVSVRSRSSNAPSTARASMGPPAPAGSSANQWAGQGPVDWTSTKARTRRVGSARNPSRASAPISTTAGSPAA